MKSYETLAALFSELPQVKAVTIAGSFVAPIKDCHSDYDVYIYHEGPISRETRRELLSKLGGECNIGASFFEEGDEVHFASSPYLDIMYRDIRWIDGEIADVWEYHHARLGYTTCFIFNLVNSQILFDRDGYFASLQKRVSGAYPEELRKNIIWKNMAQISGSYQGEGGDQLDRPLEAPYMKQLKLAILRDDPVSLNHRTAALLASLFDVLFAYSKVLHPGEKKLEKYLVTYGVKVPEGFSENLRRALHACASGENLLDHLQTLVDSVDRMVREED